MEKMNGILLDSRTPLVNFMLSILAQLELCIDQTPFRRSIL